jgi:hypothetical protein
LAFARAFLWPGHVADMRWSHRPCAHARHPLRPVLLPQLLFLTRVLQTRATPFKRCARCSGAGHGNSLVQQSLPHSQNRKHACCATEPNVRASTKARTLQSLVSWVAMRPPSLSWSAESDNWSDKAHCCVERCAAVPVSRSVSTRCTDIEVSNGTDCGLSV